MIKRGFLKRLEDLCNIAKAIFMLVIIGTCILQSSEANATLWGKYSGNPVFSSSGSGAWDDPLIGSSVLKDDSEPVDKYKMWYVGGETVAGEGMSIGYATSSDGANWVPYPSNPVMTHGNTWDMNGFSGINVIKDGSTYKLWYEGVDNNGVNQIGYATSSDGINWTPYQNNPVFSPDVNGSWDDDDVGNPWIIKEGSSYKMWYWGDNQQTDIDQIGLATSNDGITWQRSENSAVLAPNPAIVWENGEGVGTPKVTRNASGYIMAYHAADQSGTIRIGLATSSDGATWIKSNNNPILNIGIGTDWDGVSIVTASLIEDDSTFKLWFMGVDSAGTIKVGLATPRISFIGISKSVEYYHADLYNIDLDLLGDLSISSVSIQAPSGNYDLVNEGMGSFWYGISFADEAAMAAVPAGDYIFTLTYLDGTTDTTTVVYEEPGGGNIPLITEEPILNNPTPFDSSVFPTTTFEWTAITDTNINSITLDWVPVSGSGLSGHTRIPDPAITDFDPVQLSESTDYIVSLAFNRGYGGLINSDGIEYVIDADSEQKYYFTTAVIPFHPYDIDQNWIIGDFELLNAIDDWAGGSLGDFDLLNLIDFWAVGCYQWDALNNQYKSGCSTVISGTAAAGAPIVGIVTVKGANGGTASSPISDDGSYSVNVSALTAPYILYAQGTIDRNKSINIYSSGVAPGNINITPITDFILRYALSSNSPANAYNSWDGTQITSTDLNDAETTVQQQLTPVLSAVGLPSNANLMSDSFSVDQAGMNIALVALDITYDGLAVTVQNNYTGSAYTDNDITTQEADGLPSADEANTLVVITDSDAINQVWDIIEGLYATSLPDLDTLNTVWAPNMSDDFLDNGYNKTQEINDVANDIHPDQIGITIYAMIIKQLTGTPYQKAYSVRLLYSGELSDPGDTVMVYDGSKWLLYGNQMWVKLRYNFCTLMTIDSYGNDSFKSGFEVHTSDENLFLYNRGVRSAIITGNGLPANGHILEHGYPRSNHMGNYGQQYYMDDDNIISQISENETYTVRFYSQAPDVVSLNDVPLKTQETIIPYKPVLMSEFNASMFPTIISPTSHELSAVNIPGILNVQWIDPSDKEVEDINIKWVDGSGYNSVSVNASPSRTVSLDTTAASLPVYSAFLELISYDIFERFFSVDWQFQ